MTFVQNNLWSDILGSPAKGPCFSAVANFLSKSKVNLQNMFLTCQKRIDAFGFNKVAFCPKSFYLMLGFLSSRLGYPSPSLQTSSFLRRLFFWHWKPDNTVVSGRWARYQLDVASAWVLSVYQQVLRLEIAVDDATPVQVVERLNDARRVKTRRVVIEVAPEERNSVRGKMQMRLLRIFLLLFRFGSSCLVQKKGLMDVFWLMKAFTHTCLSGQSTIRRPGKLPATCTNTFGPWMCGVTWNEEHVKKMSDLSVQRFCQPDLDRHRCSLVFCAFVRWVHVRFYLVAIKVFN